MKKSTDENGLVLADGNFKCQACGKSMKKISWKICAGAHDAGKEVEQIVYECPTDKNTLCVELTTGNPSEFAVDAELTFVPHSNIE